MNLFSYTPPQDHPPGTSIAGIAWHPKLEEVRLSITNPSNGDYQDLDILMQPREWIYRAAIFGDSPSVCSLFQAGENKLSFSRLTKDGPTTFYANPVGNGFDPYVSSGDMSATLATDGGYRLRCQTLPANSTVIIVFALVTPPGSDLLPRPPENGVPGSFAVAASTLKGVSNPLDVLGNRPSSKSFVVHEKYVRGLRPYSSTWGIDGTHVTRLGSNVKSVPGL